MAGLILKLRAHEQVLVNGVVMQNGDRNARLIIKTPDAKILRLRDAIHPEEVDTPVKRVCYIAQLAVAGEAEPERAQAQLVSGIGQLRDAFGVRLAGRELDEAERAVDACNFYAAMRALRRLLPVEAELLSRAGAPAALAGANGEARP